MDVCSRGMYCVSVLLRCCYLVLLFGKLMCMFDGVGKCCV